MSMENGEWVHNSSTGSTNRNRSFSGKNGSTLPYDLLRICTCGKEVVVHTSWTTTNPGRRFRGCPGNKGQYCRSFQWVDPPMCCCSKEIIPGLPNRLSQYETAVKCAKERLEIEQTRRRRSTRLLFHASYVGL
ncbi:UNVERIFIED_CONTAM: hypothetical protein Sradi_3637500 [Sesamum radiatum]|uniref:GRF-type domain-containing protein n=1 Tax=Sesamum radiatum TaxID=300843 RepID=A0AAW2QI54_SESRA